MSDDQKIIKIKAYHNYTMFPKAPIKLGVGDNTFGITVWFVKELIDGDLDEELFDRLTITGTFEEVIQPKKEYTILAKEKNHEKYGLQYELLFIGEVQDLSNVSNQKAFLQTFLTSLQIEEMFKVLENPLKTIEEHDIEGLKKVHGIGEYISRCIVDRFEEVKDNSKIYLELDGLGLTPNFIQKLISRYKSPNLIVSIVKNNPYRLTFELDGVGFKTADKIALNNGISHTSPDRIKGYINYLLSTIGERGNSYITSSELTQYIFDEFGGKENILEIYYEDDDEEIIIGNNISQAIEELQKEDILVVEDIGDKANRRVYLKKYYELEKQIAYHLKRIMSSPNKFVYDDWEEVVSQLEMKQGWTFTDEQKQGIKLALDSQVCLVTGGAGSGKSSLVSGDLQALKNYSFAQCALSGKAGARLQEVTGKEGHTIHRLLEFNPSLGFTHNESNPLDYNIVILDEISMVGGEIFLSLIRAIPNNCKLMILGDMGQLESIGCLNLASDLYHSKYIPTVELTKIHRQAQKSGIIVSSRKVGNGESLFDRDFEGQFVTGELQDMFFDIHSGTEQTRDKVIQHFKNHYNGELVNKDIMNIQIISPIKERGNSSVLNLNNDVQEYINPKSPYIEEIQVTIDGDKSFFIRENDKIMCVINQYQKKTVNEDLVNIFNGWVGMVKEINEIDNKVLIYFPMIDETVVFTTAEAKKSLILGYATTCHKLQGSSAKVIIGALDYSTPPNMRTKELLYTLLTRAEKVCVLVGQNKAIDDAVKTSGISTKKTFLKEMLDSNIDLNKSENRSENG